MIYARYSSDNQREESINAQVYECQEYAQRNGYIVVKTYIDEATSATTDDRPNFLAMFNDAKLNYFNTVLIHKLDRFARNRYDSAVYKKKLKELGIRLISITQPFDDSPESSILEAVLEGMDEFYSKNLAREAMKGMKENARNCLHNGGIPPLGLDVTEDKKYVINDLEAQIVRLIFDMYTKGQGYNKILQELDRLGFKSKIGKPFSKNSLHDILRNEKYNGVYLFNRTISKNNGKRNNHKDKPDSEIIRIPKGIPRIIEEKLFQNVQAIMDSRKLHKERARLKAITNYLLSGKVRCGKCGAAMVGNSMKSPRNYAYYECNFRDRKQTCDSPRIKKEKLETLVLEVMQEYIFVNIPELVERVNIINREKHQQAKNTIANIQARLKEIQIKNSHLLKAIEDGCYSKIINDKLKEYELFEKELIKELDEQIRKQKASTISAEFISAMLEEARKKIFVYKDEIETKNLIQKFVNQVTVYEDEIQVSLNLILDANGGGEGSLIVSKNIT